MGLVCSLHRQFYGVCSRRVNDCLRGKFLHGFCRRFFIQTDSHSKLFALSFGPPCKLLEFLLADGKRGYVQVASQMIFFFPEGHLMASYSRYPGCFQACRPSSDYQNFFLRIGFADCLLPMGTAAVQGTIESHMLHDRAVQAVQAADTGTHVFLSSLQYLGSQLRICQMSLGRAHSVHLPLCHSLLPDFGIILAGSTAGNRNMESLFKLFYGLEDAFGLASCSGRALLQGKGLVSTLGLKINKINSFPLQPQGKDHGILKV